MIRNLSSYRTPDEVFYDPAIRMPIRQPDASFAFLFFDLIKGGRIVGNNGVQHDGRTYRLTSLQKHLEYYGERVDVRINPDDVREAIVYDRRTGAYLCYALLVEEATYDTRDEITRQLIARVFRDGRDLTRMAKAHVEGAKERLAEYRRAKLEYLKRRAVEIRAAREQKQAALTSTEPVTVIGPFSAIAREQEAVQEVELTAAVIAEILDADDAGAKPEPTPLCRVSTRKRERKEPPTTRRLRQDEIARKLGRSRRTLVKYLSGDLPWPESMEERYNAYAGMQVAADGTDIADIPGESGPSRTRSDGEFSYANIAKAIGMNRKSLLLCRSGKRRWPEGKQALYEDLVKKRSAQR